MRYAFLFPGQGSQRPGMGRELYDAFAESREVFDLADRTLGFSLSTLCFEGPADALALTENTQPAILTVSVAALRALARRGLRPAAAAGHSLGEYAAQVCAGTLGFAAALTAVRQRGRFMQQAVAVGEGAMAAILGIERAKVEEACARAVTEGVVAPANFNGPSQTVIAGAAAAVERAVALCREAGARKAVMLPVSAPFHCELMRPAAERLRGVLDAVAFGEPGLPVFTNVDAAAVHDGASSRNALVRQVVAPVRWHEIVEAIVALGITQFVEVGPGKVLAGLVRGIHRGATVHGAGDPPGVDRAVAALGAASVEAG